MCTVTVGNHEISNGNNPVQQNIGGFEAKKCLIGSKLPLNHWGSILTKGHVNIFEQSNVKMVFPNRVTRNFPALKTAK